MAEFTERNKVVLEALRAPSEPIFALHGVSVKRANGKGFLNVSRCPWCNHGEKGSPNWQCGVIETPGPRGYAHGYKCFHPHDAQDGDDTPAYADVLVALGHISQEEARWAKTLRQTLEIQRQTQVVRRSVESLGGGSSRVREVAHRRLQAHSQAKNWLEKTRGYSPYVAEHFMLGLSEAYTPHGDREPLHADALTAPLKGRDGRFYGKYVNYAIPDITQDRRDKRLKSWSAGPARTFYSDKADPLCQCDLEQLPSTI